jgi:hypothetical protein
MNNFYLIVFAMFDKTNVGLVYKYETTKEKFVELIF